MLRDGASDLRSQRSRRALVRSFGHKRTFESGPPPSPLVVHPPAMDGRRAGWGRAGTRRPETSIGHTVFELEEVIQHPRPTASLLGHARSSTARTRSPTRSIAGVTTTHDQTTHDAPRMRRGARERLAVGTGYHGGRQRGADRPRPRLRLRLASGDLAHQAAHPMRRSPVGQPGNAGAGHLGGAMRVQPQPTRLQLGRVRRAVPASTGYWPGRAEQWGQDDRSVFNGRANIIVSVRMAHAAGSWSPWVGCG